MSTTGWFRKSFGLGQARRAVTSLTRVFVALTALASLSTAGFSQTYSTKFEGTEDPLSEGGKWSNSGLDWTRIRKSGGIAYGTQSGTETGAKKYADSYAILSGFPPDQEAWGEAYIAHPNSKCHQEVEILLRWTSSPHRTTGYECFARCVAGGSSYVQIVRWDGPLGKFTYLANMGGADFGLKSGDTLKASIVGNVITVSINGVKKAQVKDDTFKTGNPGIGTFLACNGREGMGTSADFGFKSFTARGIEGSRSFPAAADDAARGPRPGVGLFFKASEVAALRAKIERPPCQSAYRELVKQADAAMARWPDDKVKLRLEELAPKLPDLTMEFVPRQYAPEGGPAAGKALEDYATRGAPAAAFVYLMTGDRKYAAFAWEVFDLCGKVNRWGWFPWAGSHMPQIHFGTVSRNLCLVADCTWDALTPTQRQYVRQTIAAKCVEPYFRIVLHTPGMGLYHLRSRNQGNNALSAALIGSLLVGDAVPENRIWSGSLLQTFHWAITHDIGWMGQGLESGIGGYWSVSVQNLYTAAAALANVRGIDLRGHPGFEQATYYPVVHEVTVPPVGMFTEPIDRDRAAPVMGVIAGKPIELPGGGSTTCGPWWLDYAVRFPESPAHCFARKGMIAAERIRTVDAHQGTLSEVLTIAWWDDRLLSPARPPKDLALFTDRIAGIRSGYGFGETCLYFNGDLFLSARKEILGTTSGMSWHFPWHQYQITESGIETEGEPFAPSMVIDQATDDGRFAFFHARSGLSNVAYYPSVGQRESYKHYERRERSVLYVRGEKNRPDYFVFLDDVRHGEPRWHAWTWHLWDSAANPNNYGRFVPQGPGAVRAERPNADLWIQFLMPGQVAVEQHGIPSQPSVSYQMDHNARMMRAVAGACQPDEAQPVVIPPAAWGNLGEVQGDVLYVEKPPTEKPVKAETVTGLTGAMRYRWSLRCKEEGYRVYEATAWAIDLELLDSEGHVLAKPQTPYGHPDPLRLGAPRSDAPTHDWTETVQYFDAPAGSVACRATLRAVGSAHYFTLGKLWLSPITLQPVGKPQRATAQKFLTLVMPLDKGASPPKITAGKDGRAVVAHGDGSTDEIAIAPDGALRASGKTGTGSERREVPVPVFPLTLTRRKGGEIVATFPDPAGHSGTPLGGLKTNSDASARRLAAGLKPVLDRLAAERDALVKQGRKNLASGAKVTASATRDDRFGPTKVVDNQTAEYPADGHLDYSQGVVWSSGRFVGYGAGKESLLANRDSWPLYVRPTYWLLPEETLGHVEIALARPATVDLVRMLNTSNAGLNDFATHAFRVELYDQSGKLLAAKEGSFGKAFDRPFEQAFFVPAWFSRYTPSFAGMLEPGLSVPFGDGWREVRFGSVPGVAFVRVVVTKYWGIGGGLNEVQVYAAQP
jgi:hypothetical protein